MFKFSYIKILKEKISKNCIFSGESAYNNNQNGHNQNGHSNSMVRNVEHFSDNIYEG